jgi:regulatory protein
VTGRRGPRAFGDAAGRDGFKSPDNDEDAQHDSAAEDDSALSDDVNEREEPSVITSVNVRRAAMDLLARREHSFRELQTKLVQRFGDSPLVRAEIARLRDERLQSDERFAEAYLFSRSRRLYGPGRIKAELRERGIDDTVIAALFREAEIDWQTNLRQLVETRFGKQPAADFKEKAKRLRFLQYRGFSADDVGGIIL